MEEMRIQGEQQRIQFYLQKEQQQKFKETERQLKKLIRQINSSRYEKNTSMKLQQFDRYFKMRDQYLVDKYQKLLKNFLKEDSSRLSSKTKLKSISQIQQRNDIEQIQQIFQVKEIDFQAFQEFNSLQLRKQQSQPLEYRRDHFKHVLNTKKHAEIMIYKSLIHQQRELIALKVNFYLSMGQTVQNNELLRNFYKYSIEKKSINAFTENNIYQVHYRSRFQVQNTIQKAMILANQNQYSQALELLKNQYYSQSSTNTQTNIQLHKYQKQLLLDKIIKLLKQSTHNPEQDLRIFDQAIKSSQFQKVQITFLRNQFIENLCSNPTAYNIRQIQSYYSTYIDTQNDPYAYLKIRQKSQVLCMLNRFLQAIQESNIALDVIDPNNYPEIAEILFQKGLIYKKLGLFTNFIECVNEAVQIRPQLKNRKMKDINSLYLSSQLNENNKMPNPLLNGKDFVKKLWTCKRYFEKYRPGNKIISISQPNIEFTHIERKMILTQIAENFNQDDYMEISQYYESKIAHQQDKDKKAEMLVQKAEFQKKVKRNENGIESFNRAVDLYDQQFEYLQKSILLQKKAYYLKSLQECDLALDSIIQSNRIMLNRQDNIRRNQLYIFLRQIIQNQSINEQTLQRANLIYLSPQIYRPFKCNLSRKYQKAIKLSLRQSQDFYGQQDLIQQSIQLLRQVIQTQSAFFDKSFLHKKIAQLYLLCTDKQYQYLTQMDEAIKNEQFDKQRLVIQKNFVLYGRFVKQRNQASHRNILRYFDHLLQTNSEPIEEIQTLRDKYSKYLIKRQYIERKQKQKQKSKLKLKLKLKQKYHKQQEQYFILIKIQDISQIVRIVNLVKKSKHIQILKDKCRYLIKASDEQNQLQQIGKIIQELTQLYGEEISQFDRKELIFMEIQYNERLGRHNRIEDLYERLSSLNQQNLGYQIQYLYRNQGLKKIEKIVESVDNATIKVKIYRKLAKLALQQAKLFKKAFQSEAEYKKRKKYKFQQGIKWLKQAFKYSNNYFEVKQIVEELNFIYQKFLKLSKIESLRFHYELLDQYGLGNEFIFTDLLFQKWTYPQRQKDKYGQKIPNPQVTKQLSKLHQQEHNFQKIYQLLKSQSKHIRLADIFENLFKYNIELKIGRFNYLLERWIKGFWQQGLYKKALQVFVVNVFVEKMNSQISQYVEHQFLRRCYKVLEMFLMRKYKQCIQQIESLKRDQQQFKFKQPILYRDNLPLSNLNKLGVFIQKVKILSLWQLQKYEQAKTLLVNLSRFVSMQQQYIKTENITQNRAQIKNNHQQSQSNNNRQYSFTCSILNVLQDMQKLKKFQKIRIYNNHNN